MNVTVDGTQQFSDIQEIVPEITPADLDKIRALAATAICSGDELLYFKRDKHGTVRSFATLPRKRAFVICLKEEDIPDRKNRGGECSFRPSLFVPWESEKQVRWCAKITKIDPLFEEKELMVKMGEEGHGPKILATGEYNLKQIIISELAYCDLSVFNGSLTKLEVLECIDSIALALKYMHSIDMLHCDVKPENILMIKDKRWSAKLTDFGHSIPAEQRRPFYGTPAYFSWEQFLAISYGDKTLFEARKESVDLWGLGIVIYTLVRGHCPPWCQYIDAVRAKIFPDDDYLLYLAYYQEFVTESTSSDEPLDHLYRNLLQKDPNVRMSLDEIQKWIEDQKKRLRHAPKQHARQSAE